MEEKLLNNKKNGMGVLLVLIVSYVIAIAMIVFGAIQMDAHRYLPGVPVFVVGMVWACLGWIFFCGLKVLKPQEALVLTLFGKYTGTLKGEGFYWVNPFCTAVNPAAKTKLNQSGDVDGGHSGKSILLNTGSGSGSGTAEMVSKKVSLKIMTLNNARQKINDCLGNPVEIGIAVMWRVTDTAKAVFNVDNYKEYLLTECVRQRKKNGRYVSDEIDVPPELDLQ